MPHVPLPQGQAASPVFPAPLVFLKERLLCYDVWLQKKTHLPSTDIRNILVRSNSEAPVIDFPEETVRESYEYFCDPIKERDHWLL